MAIWRAKFTSSMPRVVYRLRIKLQDHGLHNARPGLQGIYHEPCQNVDVSICKTSKRDDGGCFSSHRSGRRVKQAAAENLPFDRRMGGHRQSPAVASLNRCSAISCNQLERDGTAQIGRTVRVCQSCCISGFGSICFSTGGVSIPRPGSSFERTVIA